MEERCAALLLSLAINCDSKIRKHHKEVGFDISHHVTFVKYWAPSCLAWLDILFIWGPVGGGESLPQGFSSECSLKGRIYELLRSLARFWRIGPECMIHCTASK